MTNPAPTNSQEPRPDEGAGAPIHNAATDEVMAALVVELRRQAPGSVDLSEADNFTLFQIFEPINLRKLASVALDASLKALRPDR